MNTPKAEANTTAAPGIMGKSRSHSVFRSLLSAISAVVHCKSFFRLTNSLYTARRAASVCVAAKAGKSGVAATLVRASDEPYRFTTGVVAIEEIANKEKVFPCEWINENGTGLTEEYIRYALPLIQGELTPVYENGLPKHIQPIK